MSRQRKLTAVVEYRLHLGLVDWSQLRAELARAWAAERRWNSTIACGSRDCRTKNWSPCSIGGRSSIGELPVSRYRPSRVIDARRSTCRRDSATAPMIVRHGLGNRASTTAPDRAAIQNRPAAESPAEERPLCASQKNCGDAAAESIQCDRHAKAQGVRSSESTTAHLMIPRITHGITTRWKPRRTESSIRVNTTSRTPLTLLLSAGVHAKVKMLRGVPLYRVTDSSYWHGLTRRPPPFKNSK